MDFNSIKNPQVREYIRKKMAGEEDLSQAQDVQAGIGYANTAGSALTDLANSNKQDVILGNRLDSLGRAPKVVSSPDKQYDDMGSGKLAAQGVSRAEQSLAGIEAPPTVRDEEDPASDISRLWQDTAKKAAPSQDFSKFSASQIRKILPSMESRVSKESAKAEPRVDPRAERLKDIKLETAEAKLNKAKAPKALSGEGMKRSDSAKMGLEAAQGMKDALAKGTNTFSMMGDNKFTMNATRWEEAIGRMQSGGAIQTDEADRFRGMAPTKWDSKEIQEEKLEWMLSEMTKRLETLSGPTKQAPQAPGGAKDVGTMSIEELEAELGGS